MNRDGKHVVILGGGFGGLSAAKRLRELLPAEDTITLIDRTGSMTQGLSNLWIMRGWQTPQDALVQPTKAALQGIGLLVGEVQKIDTEHQHIHTAGETVAYDALIIALGADLNLDLLPGLRKALTEGLVGEFYTPAGAQAVHDRLTAMSSGVVPIAVAALPYKCPAAPYEAALLLDDLLTERGLRSNFQLAIYTPEPQPMPVAGSEVGQRLVAMLAQKKIAFRPNTPVQAIQDKHLVLASGETVAFDYALVVPPHQPPPAVRQAGFSEGGWIPVDPRTLTTSIDGVWAMGDNALIALPNGKPLPKAGVFARAQAAAVASGVARYLGHDAAATAFTGEGYCYIEIGHGLAAKGGGNFYNPAGPDITLHDPSAARHEDKKRDEQSWLRLWNT